MVNVTPHDWTRPPTAGWRSLRFLHRFLLVCFFFPSTTRPAHIAPRGKCPLLKRFGDHAWMLFLVGRSIFGSATQNAIVCMHSSACLEQQPASRAQCHYCAYSVYFHVELFLVTPEQHITASSIIAAPPIDTSAVPCSRHDGWRARDRRDSFHHPRFIVLARRTPITFLAS